MTPEYLSPEDADAALCAWEYLVENRETLAFKPMFFAHGTPALRSTAIPAGRIAQAVYALLEGRSLAYTLAFDFSFVPAVLEQLDWRKLVAHHLYSGTPYVPDLETILDNLIRDDPSSFISCDPRDEWISRATAAAHKIWAYPQLIADHPEAAQAAFRDQTPPETFAQNLGEKYGLSPMSDWNLKA